MKTRKVIEQVVSVIENMPKEVAKCKVGYEVAWTRDTVYYDKQLVDFVQKSVDELKYSNQKKSIPVPDTTLSLLRI